jgi:hypothetical protein
MFEGHSTELAEAVDDITEWIHTLDVGCGNRARRDAGHDRPASLCATWRFCTLPPPTSSPCRVPLRSGLRDSHRQDAVLKLRMHT